MKTLMVVVMVLVVNQVMADQQPIKEECRMALIWREQFIKSMKEIEFRKTHSQELNMAYFTLAQRYLEKFQFENDINKCNLPAP